MSQSVCLERKIQPCVYNCFLSFSSKTMISLKKTEVLSFGQADAGSQKNGKSSIGRSSSMAAENEKWTKGNNAVETI